MSTKKSKLDLLVRVRYQNPLPPPPFPPKLLHIPTHPNRYSKLEFAAQLAADTPFPMVVDAEMGMPLDLSQYRGLWDYDHTTTEEDYELNPDPNNLPELDPKDEFLVSDLQSIYDTSSNPTASHEPSSNPSWLRDRKSTQSAPQVGAARELRREEEDVNLDVSPAAQISSIEASFPDPLEPFDLSTLRHPTKSKLKAVEVFEILPDSNIWANAYDLVRFPERPGDTNLETADPRTSTAIIRPTIGEDGESFLSYYLTSTDAESETFTTSRIESLRKSTLARSNPLYDDDTKPEDEATFQFVRDYETAKIETEVPDEFLIVLDDGEQGGSGLKGAFYKNIERKYVLKKKRQNRQDDADRWDVIRVSHAPFTSEERAERVEVAAEVTDPDYLARAQAQALQAEAEEKMEVDGGANDVGARGVGGTLGPSHNGNDIKRAGSMDSE